MKKIVIIVGHPMKDSFSGILAESYKKGAESAGAEVRIMYLGDLKFDPILRNGYKKVQKLEPDLQKASDNLCWAEHWVFVHPIWWGSVPALLKGFFDRVFLPGVMFKYQKGNPLPLQLMKGKTARVMATMDSPLVFYKLIVGKPAENMFKKAIFGFCGVGPVNFSYFSLVGKSDETKKSEWKKVAEFLGKKMI